MTINTITVRDACIDDIDALVSLINTLGYPAPANEIKLRFENIFGRNEYRTLLAVTGNGQVAGFIGMMESYGYEHNAKYVRVLALAVNENFRNSGVGRILMAQAEKWAAELNAYMIVLTSGLRDERKAAHAFYQRIGFEIKSAGFVKYL